MWTVFIVLNLGALLCAGSTSPPSPVNVTFSSVNLRNVLQWFPGSGTPDDTLFTVQYAIYGDSVEGKKGKRVHWRPVRRCTEIVRSWCDLSNETWDLEQGYHARVRAVRHKASSKWALTHRRFDPKTDTRFGSPLVSVEIEDNNAIITVKGPMRYQPNNHTPEVSMATVYPQMIYNLSIGNTHRGLMHHFPVSGLYKYRLMDYDTEYCFSARARFLSMPIQCQPSAWQCITTPQDPVIAQLQRLVVGIVVPSLCMCMLALVGYLLYHYLTGKGQKSPYILHPPAFHPPVLTFPPENPKLILITIFKEPDVALPSGYSSQRPQALQQPGEPWDDLSVDYGFVGEAPNMAINGEDEDIHPTGEHGECVLRDTYEKKAWRVEDGHSTGHTQKDVSTLLQAHAWSQPESLTQAQAPLLSFLEEVDGGQEEDPAFPALFTNSTPQTAPSSNLPTNNQGGMGEEKDGKVSVRTDGEIDGGVKEWSEDVKVPLVSSYAFQNTTHMSTSHSDSYGVVGPAAAVEEADEEEKGANCIDWNPETRKLVVPLMLLEYNKEDEWDGLIQGEDVGENRMEEGEEEDLMNSELRLENVFVRQSSNEKAEAQRGSERGGGTGWEAEDLLTKWNLVISMDQ